MTLFLLAWLCVDTIAIVWLVGWCLSLTHDVEEHEQTIRLLMNPWSKTKPEGKS